MSQVVHRTRVAVHVAEAILPGSGLLCTTEAEKSRKSTRIQGGTPEKRRETTRNEGKRGETTGLQCTPT